MELLCKKCMYFDNDEKPIYCPSLSCQKAYETISNHWGQTYCIPTEIYYTCNKFGEDLQYIMNHECLEYMYKENKLENRLDLNYE